MLVCTSPLESRVDGVIGTVDINIIDEEKKKKLIKKMAENLHPMVRMFVSTWFLVANSYNLLLFFLTAVLL